MRILYIGDVMGEVGLKVVAQILPDLIKESKTDIVIAQAENATDGKGVSLDDFQKLRNIGVDFCTGGNWTLNKPEIFGALNDPKQPIVRPANYPEGTPGVAYKILSHATGSVLIVSLLGDIVGKDSDNPMQNPLKIIDEILKETSKTDLSATIVNFHGDYSSQKRVIGYYLDGRVSAVIGDHWHVPTADAMILPNGTAHITDVGMCGALHSSLGVKTNIIVERWLSGKASRNVLENAGPYQFNAVLVDIDSKTGLAKSISQIQKSYN